MLDNTKNFCKVTVSTGYDETATSIDLKSGDGTKLPSVPFQLTWWDSSTYPDPSDDPNVEIVHVTDVAGDTLTLERGQEGTNASTKNTTGKTYLMINALTSKMISDMTLGGEELPIDSGDHIHFTISHEPVQRLWLMRGGVPQSKLLGDYTITGTDIALATPLNAAAGETLVAMID